MTSRNPGPTSGASRDVTAAKAQESSTAGDVVKVPFQVSERQVRDLITAMETLTHYLVLHEDNLRTMVNALRHELTQTTTLRATITGKLAVITGREPIIPSRRSISRRQLEVTLMAYKGNVLQTARALGKQRRQIQRLLKYYDLNARSCRNLPPEEAGSGQAPTSRPDAPDEPKSRSEPDPESYNVGSSANDER